MAERNKGMVLTTEDILRIDIRGFKGHWNFNIVSKVTGKLIWSKENKEHASIGYEVYMDRNDPYIRFKYNYNDETISYDVRLEFTKPNYGGKRWWFVCPYKGTRCAVLYLSPLSMKFISRRAFKHLPYRSQHECPINRAIRRKNRLGARYGATSDDGTYFERPKGMHIKTYYRRLSQLDTMMYRADALILARFSNYIK